MAANLLRRAGWHAVVFERNQEALTGRGVGLGTHPQLITVLRRAAIAFDATMGITVPKVVCLDRAGNVILEQPSARIMSAWSRLYRALRAALPAQDYRLGKKLRRIEQDSGGVSAIFEDSTSERGDLLVGADGIRSTVREQFLPQTQPALLATSPGAPCWTKPACRARPTARFSSFTHSACPKASSCSAIRCRGATATRPPDAAATTSSGIGPPTWLP
ncbi:MAG: FAD-dependent monooxygenase [Xanthobacteraceae bacterium]